MNFLFFLIVVIVVIVIFGIAFGVCWIGCRITAHKLNTRYGTDYTASDIFWFGEYIRVSDYTKIKK